MLERQDLTTEESVRNDVTMWLTRKDFELKYIATTRGRPRGSQPRGRPRNAKPPDIIAKRRTQNSYYFIEAKGDSPSTTNLYGVIGQIVVQKARTTPASYAVALPVSYKRTILDVLSLRAWKQARFNIILVKSNHSVVEFRPGKRNLENIRGL